MFHYDDPFILQRLLSRAAVHGAEHIRLQICNFVYCRLMMWKDAQECALYIQCSILCIYISEYCVRLCTV